MKLLRFGERGQEKPGALDAQGRIRDLSSVVGDIDGSILGDASLAKLRGVDLASLPLVADGVRIGPCVGRVGKFTTGGPMGVGDLVGRNSVQEGEKWASAIAVAR